MKNSLLEMLLSLFQSAIQSKNGEDNDNMLQDMHNFSVIEEVPIKLEFIREQKQNSIRVFVLKERLKFNEESYILLLNLYNLQIFSFELLEEIVDELIFSDSNLITYNEAKTVIRSVASENLDMSELAFLELLFYQKEDGVLLN